ncbi:IclR family transcriptional regulator [Salinactinospora qingdaonensis]|uniref:IclR family transcriptional regulator n=1 Tax=Salinactinospora qingdaonensis TaxID=702744 RepID=A0ABP7FEC3_9ACTN
MSDNRQRRSGAESSRKLLNLMLAFNERNHTRSAADLAAALDMPISSVYRFLSVLKDTGLVEEAGHGEYRLSWLFVGLARAAGAAADDLERLARPVLEEVARESGETTLLIKRVGWSATCVDRVESVHPVRLQFDPGQPMSLHLGSAARVLLASMPAAEREAYLDTLPDLGKLERDQIEADVDTVARTGWVESFGEVDEGIWGTAAAIHDGETVVAALGLAGPLYRLRQDDRERIIELVNNGARTLSDTLRRQAEVPGGPPSAKRGPSA